MFEYSIATSGTSLFGQTNTGFGVAAATASGTTSSKFAPPDGSDTMIKNGISQTVKTRHFCITAMKPYEHKSLEVRTGRMMNPGLVCL